MICNLDCFNCGYDDCIRPMTQDDNERAAKWRKNNPEKVKEIRRRQYLKNQEKEKEYQRQRYQKIKDDPNYKTHKKTLNKAYREKNIEKLRQKDREYYWKNREKRLEYARKYREKQKAVG